MVGNLFEANFEFFLLLKIFFSDSDKSDKSEEEIPKMRPISATVTPKQKKEEKMLAPIENDEYDDSSSIK